MKQIINLFSEIFSKMPYVFFVLFFTIFFQAFLTTVTVISLTPLVDFLMNNIENKSRITILFENLTYLILGIDAFNLPFLIFFIGTVYLFSGVISVIAQYIILVVEYRLVNYLWLTTLNSYLLSKFTFFSQSNIGEIENTLLNEVRKVAEIFAVIARTFANLIQVFILIIAPLTLSPFLTLIFIVLIAILISPIIIIKKISYNIGKKNTLAANEMLNFIQQTLSSIKIIQSFGKHKSTINLYRKVIKDFSKSSILFQTLFRTVNIMFVPLGIVAALITLYISISFEILLAELAMIFFAFSRMLPILGTLIQDRTKVAGLVPAYEQLLLFRNKTKLYKEKNGEIIFSALNDKIKIKDLHFSYPSRINTLKNINLEIKKGEITCLVGKSGSGKTTIADILLGLHKIEDNMVFIDNIDINLLDLNVYRQKIGYVSQETILFNMSIKDNILWANPNLTESELHDICKKTNAFEFINEFPEKFDTIVGDRGVRLSGGQKQRLGLARAVAKKPSILILDEATSNLDSNSEILIQNSIKELSKNITIIIIAHRYSSIKNSDKIYILNDGNLVGSGKYNELLNNNDNYFYNLIKDQIN